MLPSPRSELESIARRTRRWRRGNRVEPDIHRPRAAIASPAASLASFTGETHTVRRTRLYAAAVFLAGAFALLWAWVFASNDPVLLAVDGSYYSLRVGFIVLRCLLATVVAGVLGSELSLTRKQLDVIEHLLFLGLTCTMVASQYPSDSN